MNSERVCSEDASPEVTAQIDVIIWKRVGAEAWE